MRHEYSLRRNVIADGLNQIAGIECPLPEGTFYAFPKIPEAWGDSSEVAAYLLAKAGVLPAMSLSLLKFVGQASLVDDAMLPS